ncbi:PREDICTED: protein-associating with the carboxyl-terminal domain of ezrin [Papilio polytes]|uniref:protein-associating with the carboxyl-terminal domain of ezrin n=1 Tax=Papilio polytes TaxID=76194 RepID=UPI00067662D6|nr:PREDICTED: protein-associating with the carboxyl-terminal domain of ezrin [Papilio polytes]
MMGNENSHLSGLKIDERPTETTDFWSHFQATISDSCRYFSLKDDGSVSVFKGEVVLGPLWITATPLEKFSNNLLKYRHPCIVRYISSWQQRTFHLVTEYVQPLSQVLNEQTPLQICIGLNNLLRALVFLHEQAGVSHNNVSMSSIYVSGDGQWKLGGLQYLCTFTDLNHSYLKHARIHRYDKAVDPDEESQELISKVDQYAYAVLVFDAFKGRNDDDVPYLNDFKKFCKDCLQNSNPENRPNLSEVLQHDFFNHEFISIYKFLYYLPLKKEEDKSQFFSNILINLKHYDEETVANQLGGLLLSRLTLLDATARRDVIPYILKPKNDRLQNEDSTGFFSLGVFKEHVKPRLLQLFGVRDSQVRMILLMHFTKFVHVFSHEELSQHILPELLLGIKDVDDNLVASTLVCLSELVPILGADTVIGGKRSKFFTDGRPKSNSVLIDTSNMHKDVRYTTKSLSDFRCSEVYNTGVPLMFEKTMALNERPTPVGGEAQDEDKNMEPSTSMLTDSEEEWGDWDNPNRQLTLESDKIDDIDIINSSISNIDIDKAKQMQKIEQSISVEKPLTDRSLLQKAAIEAKKHIIDISELDIKSTKIDFKRSVDEFDFFADMEPVIEKHNIATETDKLQDVSSKLNFVPAEDCDENEGWGENWN